MPLYAAAAEAILGHTCLGGVFHRVAAGEPSRFERFFAALTTSRGTDPYKPDETYPDKLRGAMETVGRFVERMAAGRFDALPTHDCPSYCPFRQICHYSPARAERKAPADQARQEAD
jgi:hypothetical protein